MLVFIVLLSSALLAVCISVKPIYLQNTIDAVGSGDTRTQFLLYAASILGILVFEAVRQLALSRYRTKKLFGLKRRLTERIGGMSMRQFQEENGQNYVTILNNELDMLADSWYVTRLEFSYSLLVLAASVAALVSINLYLALIILLSTVCPILASVAMGKTVEKRTNFYTAALERLNVMIADLIHGYPTIKVNHAESAYMQRLAQENEGAAQADRKQAGAKVRVNAVIGLLAYAGEAAMVGFSIFEISRGRLTVGALVGALQLSEMLAIPTNSISYQIAEMKSVRSIRQKIDRMLAAPEELPTTEEIPPIESIELRDVSFRHPEKELFSHLSYRFEVGKKYLILGENGSGKSTLFKLLSGLETGYDGEILVNGRDARALWPALYDRLGVVLQEAFLFDDTLRQNITLYRPQPDARVEQVMRAVGMERFLAERDLDGQFQSTKGNLSGGEKQKIALARVLLGTKQVVLLDEVTAGMDAESSRNILSFLLRDPELTVISTEHKVTPETRTMYDKVLELKELRLEEMNREIG